MSRDAPEAKVAMKVANDDRPSETDETGSRKRQLSEHNKQHQRMRAQILAAHPEIRQLYGAQPLQLIAVVLLFCARWGLAWLLRDASLLIIGLLASSVGVWIVHAAGT